MSRTTRRIEVTRTYLELKSSSELRGFKLEDRRIQIKHVESPSITLYRHLYREVGRKYHWVDKLKLPDAEIEKHLSNTSVSLWVMHVEEKLAGYFELFKHADGSVEIAYFGLLQEFLGQGLGKHLLTCAVERAWKTGANRVWLHTCTLDDPAALPNYLKRGFQPYQEEKYVATLAPDED